MQVILQLEDHPLAKTHYGLNPNSDLHFKTHYLQLNYKWET